MRVFVYGTLLAGECNHGWLAGGRYLGNWTTAPRYRLVDTGPYPVLALGGRTAVRGEVYAINRLILDRLDVLEGYPADYGRVLIPTGWGRAWVYRRRRAPAGRLLFDGDWRRRPFPQ